MSESDDKPVLQYAPNGRLLRRPVKPEPKQPKVPAKGFSEGFIRKEMLWPKPGDRQTQRKYSHRLKTGTSLIFIAGMPAKGVRLGRGTWRILTYLDFDKHPAKSFPLGHWPAMSAPEATKKALEWSLDPNAWNKPPGDPPTLDQVLDRYLFEVVERKDYRTGDRIAANFKSYVRPILGKRPMYDEGAITLTDTAFLLDSIEGHAMSDKILGSLGKVFKWFATKDHLFKNPLVPGMGRNAGQPRDRKLSDEEICKLWHATGLMRDFECFALLTAQRKTKVLELQFGDIVDGYWCIRRQPREKDHGGTLKLPPLALEIIERQRTPDSESRDRVFPLPMNPGSFYEYKVALDQAIDNVGDDHWVTHDLRRSARTLMSRAGVKPWVSERVLGHKVGSQVEQVYDRFEWREDKGAAVQALADLVSSIVGLNVVPLKQQA
jgi:integrase